MSNGNHLCEGRPGASNVGSFRGNHSTRPRLLKLPGRGIACCVDKNVKKGRNVLAPIKAGNLIVGTYQGRDSSSRPPSLLSPGPKFETSPVLFKMRERVRLGIRIILGLKCQITRFSYRTQTMMIREKINNPIGGQLCLCVLDKVLLVHPGFCL